VCDIDPRRLHELFEYDPVTGQLFRRSPKYGRLLVSRKAGIDGRMYLVYRIIYRMFKGLIPPGCVIDHVDGDNSNNRLQNLRATTRAQNSQNRGHHVNNASGYKGVYYHKKCGKYAATIQGIGESRHLGLYDTAEEAARAYDRAALERWGEYARTNEMLGLFDPHSKAKAAGPDKLISTPACTRRRQAAIDRLSKKSAQSSSRRPHRPGACTCLRTSDSAPT